MAREGADPAIVRIRAPGRSLATLLLASTAAFMGGQAHAQSNAPPAVAQAERTYDIPSQSLATALSEFARQSGLQVLYPYDRLQGLRAPAVRGAYSTEEALSLLLVGSGYTASLDRAGVVRLESVARPQRLGGDDRRDDPRDDPRLGASTPLRLAPLIQAQGAPIASEDELVITGTRIRGARPAGANVMTLDAEDLRQTGRSTLHDALQTLPQNFAGSQNETTQLQTSTGGNNTTFGSSVNLRGLGADATLILVNGRRLAPGGVGNFIDISNIPLAAVDRVEILADGASATYGSDAVAGVVNIILDRDFDGAASSVRYGGVADGDLRETVVSHVMGGQFGTLSLMGGYEYRDRSALALAERELTASTDLRRFGGADFSRNTSNPGNITRVGSTNVTIAIPRGQDGTSLSQAELLVGQVNLQNGNLDGDLFPSQHSHHVFGSARLALSDDLTVFADAFAGVRDAEARDPQINATLSVPATNAWRVLNNLFPGQGALTMPYNFGADLGPLRYETRAQSALLISGVEWSLGEDWQIEATGSFAHQREDQHFLNSFNSPALTSALASSDLGAAFNPFADGSNTNPAVLAMLTFRQDARANADMEVYTLKADGPLFALPAGALRAAFGVERRQETFDIAVARTTAAGVVTPVPIQPPGERTTDALFAELFLPLVSAEMNVPLVRELELSLSVRREQSSDYGDAETPKIGVHWSLSEDLALRASWGESFKAPQFQQILGEVTASIGAAPPTVDPNADNGSTGLLQLGGPSPDLAPERGRTWTAGFDYTPPWLDGLTLHGTYFDIDFADRIARAGSVQVVFRNPTAYPGFLILDPTPAQISSYLALATRVTGATPPDGIEAIYDGRLTNLASLRVRGVDLQADWRLHSMYGAQIVVFASASGLFEFSNQPIATLPSIETLDTFNNPVDWRARAGVSWQTENWLASAAFNYTDRYHDTISVPNRRIEAWGTLDVSVARRWASGAELALSVLNFTDEDAPFVNNSLGVGFDPANASLMGRFVTLELRKRW